MPAREEGSRKNLPVRQGRDDRSLKVLYVHHAPMAGGACESLLSLLRHLPPEVTGMLLSPPGGALAVPGAAGRADLRPVSPLQLHWSLSPAVLLKARADLARLSEEIRRAQKAFAPDLIHANTWPAALAATQARLGGIPVIWHVRDLRIRPLVLNRLGGQTSDCIAISQAVREFLLAQGATPERVHLVYNGLDLAEFRPQRSREEVRQELGLPPEARVMMAVGDLVAWKRHDLLLQAARVLQPQVPELLLVVVGGHGERHAQRRSELETLAQDLGLSGKVRFTGHREDVPDLLQACDVFVHAALDEPFGRVVLEAMALGKPVVVYDAAGPGELVQKEVSGLAVTPVGSAEALAGGVLRMLTEPDLALRCGEQARQRVAAEFTADRMAAETVAVYRRVLERSEA